MSDFLYMRRYQMSEAACGNQDRLQFQLFAYFSDDSFNRTGMSENYSGQNIFRCVPANNVDG